MDPAPRRATEWPAAASDKLGESVTVTGLSPESPTAEHCGAGLVKCAGAFALGPDGMVPVRVSGPKGTIVSLQRAWVVLGDEPVDTRIDLLSTLLLLNLDSAAGPALVDVTVTAPDGSFASGDLGLTSKIVSDGLLRVARGQGGFVLPGEPPAPPKPARAVYFDAKPELAWSADQKGASAPMLVQTDVIVVQETSIRDGAACHYASEDKADHRTLYPHAADATFSAYDRRSGKKLGQRHFQGPMSECPASIDSDTGSLPVFENQAATDWLLALTPGDAPAEPIEPRNAQELPATALTPPPLEPAEAGRIAAALAGLGYLVRPDVQPLGGDGPKGFVLEARRGREHIVVSARDYAGLPGVVTGDRLAVGVAGLPAAAAQALAAKVEAAKPTGAADLTSLLEGEKLTTGAVFEDLASTRVYAAAVKCKAADGAQPVVDVLVIDDAGAGQCARSGSRYVCAAMKLGSTIDVPAGLTKVLATF
ncbi:MAG: hypothetical protein U1F43_29270 [Myxococcota bacterium]